LIFLTTGISVDLNIGQYNFFKHHDIKKMKRETVAIIITTIHYESLFNIAHMPKRAQKENAKCFI